MNLDFDHLYNRKKRQKTRNQSLAKKQKKKISKKGKRRLKKKEPKEWDVSILFYIQLLLN